MAIIIYLLKANIALATFYVFYWVVLRRNTFFSANRFYLIASVVSSFVLPLIKIKHNYDFAKAFPMTINEIPFKKFQPMLHEVIMNNQTYMPLTWLDVVGMLYWVGVSFLGLRFVYSIIRVFIILNRSEPLDFVETYTGNEYWLLQNDNPDSSFSFFNFLVLNSEDLRSNQAIISDHEEVHINQRHSWDIVLLEFVHIFCWFNPVVYLYKKSVKLIHEYIADDFVNALQPAEYAQFLFAYNFRTNMSRLSNDFFRSSLLKQRIIMLMKPKSAFWVWSSYLLSIPVIIMVMYFIIVQNVDRMIG